MPVLGIVALMLRGVLVAMVAVVIAIAATLGVWHAVEPTLNPRVAAALRDYAAPTAFGIAFVICMPLLGIVALVARGAVLALLAAAIVIAATIGLWRMIATHHHTDHPHPHHDAT
jgi:hypothetical protein